MYQVVNRLLGLSNRYLNLTELCIIKKIEHVKYQPMLFAHWQVLSDVVCQDVLCNACLRITSSSTLAVRRADDDCSMLWSS